MIEMNLVDTLRIFVSICMFSDYVDYSLLTIISD